MNIKDLLINALKSASSSFLFYSLILVSFILVSSNINYGTKQYYKQTPKKKGKYIDFFTAYIPLILSIIGYTGIEYLILKEHNNFTWLNTLFLFLAGVFICLYFLMDFGIINIDISPLPTSTFKLLYFGCLNFINIFSEKFIWDKFVVVGIIKTGIFLSEDIILPWERKYQITDGPGVTIRALSWLSFVLFSNYKF